MTALPNAHPPASRPRRPRRPRSTAVVTPIAVTIPDACKFVGLGKTSLYELIAAQKVRTKKIGRRTLVIYRSLEELISV
jgi:Helix-turn-helix domain